MAKKRRKIPILTTLLILTAITAAAAVGMRLLHIRQADSAADNMMQQLEVLIPGLGIETDIQMGAGKDPLPVITVESIDIVGCLEIPALDLRLPVASKENDAAYGCVTLDSGSPLSGEFIIVGDRDTLFRRLASTRPGDSVTFTDVDGIRYKYRVTTQYHLKNWDIGDNDLLVGYMTDDQTKFVVGCTEEK